MLPFLFIKSKPEPKIVKSLWTVNGASWYMSSGSDSSLNLIKRSRSSVKHYMITWGHNRHPAILTMKAQLCWSHPKHHAILSLGISMGCWHVIIVWAWSPECSTPCALPAQGQKKKQCASTSMREVSPLTWHLKQHKTDKWSTNQSVPQD